MTEAEARLVDDLRDCGHLLVSLVAVVDGAVVGHLAFSPVVANGHVPGVGLAPVAVLTSHRRRGIAAELVRTGLNACRDVGYGWAVVLGDPAYYGRFGFTAASAVGLHDEYGGGLAFQVLELLDNHLPRDAGLVRYGSEFASLT